MYIVVIVEEMSCIAAEDPCNGMPLQHSGSHRWSCEDLGDLENWIFEYGTSLKVLPQQNLPSRAVFHAGRLCLVPTTEKSGPSRCVPTGTKIQLFQHK